MSHEAYELEMKLLSAGIRRSPPQLDRLLADDFVEFGNSGKVYTKIRVMDALQDEPDTEFTVADFETRALSPEVILATYRVEKVRALDDQPARSLRSSIWVWSDGAWQLLFHHGTAIG